MRNAFAEEITKLAIEDLRIVLLSGDIGNRLFNPYKELHANRFLNCGVAEANMISMAAGMAMCGLRPVAYTITPFITTRCLEQIRVDICYQNVPVVIVGVGGGFSYASLGATHHSCEDIAFLRALPNMNVICAGDAVETRLALRAAVDTGHPTYIRIGKKGEPVIHKETPKFEIGKGIVLREGSEVCLLSTGNILPVALEAANQLADTNISVKVVSFHTIKPLDQELLSNVFATCSLVVTIEEHSKIGGLGGSVAEWLSDFPSQKAKLLRIGTPDAFLHETGEQDYARQRTGLTSKAIKEKILGNLDRWKLLQQF